MATGQAAIVKDEQFDPQIGIDVQGNGKIPVYAFEGDASFAVRHDPAAVDPWSQRLAGLDRLTGGRTSPQYP